jgi:hypothetical protein
MARIKSTEVLHQPDDNADLEVVDAPTRDDTMNASSAFDQDAAKGVPVRGCKDHKNLKTKAEDDEDMDDHETSDEDDVDSEVEANRKSTEAGAGAAAIGLTLEFGPSTITKGRIREREKLNYFAKGDGRAPEEEIVPNPQRDEAIVFEEYFVYGLLMPPHWALVEIMMKFRIQLHQLTPNIVVQFSKKFWVVASCGGEPTAEVFAKHYKLHYQ